MNDQGPQSLSTPELLRKAQAGDKEAFEMLLTKYQYRLTSLLFLRIGPALARRVDLDDVIQEVWTRAYQSLPRFQWRGNNSFFHWLGGIADHVVKNLARHYLQTGRVREWSLEDPDAVDALDGRRLWKQCVSPSKAMQRDERFERLRGALDQLSETHREVIILGRVRGLSIGEIAEIMERTPQAVSCLLLRALRQLRARFGSTDSFHLPDRTVDGSREGHGGDSVPDRED